MRWLLRLTAAIAALTFLGVIALLFAGGASGEGRHAAAVEIAAPASAVFAHLVDPELLPKWVGGLQKSEPISGGPPAVGSRTREVIGDGEDTFELEATITRLQPGKLLGLEFRHAEFVTRGTWVVKAPAENRTLVIYEATTRYKHPTSKLLAPVVTHLNQQKLEEDLLRLKALLEAPIAPAISDAAALTGSPAPSSAPATVPSAASATPDAAPEDPTITSSDEPASPAADVAGDVAAVDAGSPPIPVEPGATDPEVPQVDRGAAPDAPAAMPTTPAQEPPQDVPSAGDGSASPEGSAGSTVSEPRSTPAVETVPPVEAAASDAGA